jgi:hypothetical protein
VFGSFKNKKGKPEGSRYEMVLLPHHILTLSAVCQAQSNNLKVVGFEIFTAVTMKNAIFWDVAPCGSFKNGRFRVTFPLHLHGRKICV